MEDNENNKKMANCFIVDCGGSFHELFESLSAGKIIKIENEAQAKRMKDIAFDLFLDIKKR